ncbi:RHS repeat-associated core domain-containing protein [Hyalangium rubrum]|uniref:RHS repeat-associated core domain-containing protein n=1 Tax=Hyalangium rubrum TaxID=3103134 RepID=A0ABU5HIQ3_9BACT|nr:RHS repeat-associated core domain-containing protein [Hyalangium sp. s54d21]MDY7233034.1 RHS repeat-associated core domain-containing protein [Hyalangium sp. s54d21]
MVPVLMVVLAALPATPPSSRQVDLTPPPPQMQVDWNAVHARTRSFEEAHARHRASEQTLARSGTRELLETAGALCIEPPGFWDRLLPGGSDSDETLAACRKAAEQTEQASATLAQGRDAARRYLDAVAARLEASSSPYKEELLARVERQRTLLSERSAEADALAQRTAAALRGGGDSFSERLSWRWRSSEEEEDAARLLSAFQARLRNWEAPEQPILGAELTYVQGGVEAGPLPTEQMTPAYLAGASSPALDDSSEGREVELSPELRAKAQELGTARAAYDFVKNEARLDWYFGSLKGSTQTLRDRRGNDADLSALLVALLRAQGTPARFVHGTVELSLAQVAAAMGLLTGDEVAQLDAAATGGAPFTLSTESRDRALKALTAAAIPYEPVVRNGTVTAVRLVRVWVEAYVDFAEYRGVGGGTVGRQWVALEPSLLGRAKAAVTPPQLDAFTALGETPDTLTAAWLSAPTSQSMVEYVRERVETHLSAHRPDLFYSQVLWTVVPRREELPLLPGSLPYEVVAVHGESAFLPESLLQRVRLTAWNEAGALLELTLPLHQLTGHRTVLTHRPATEADAQLVQAAGGLYAAPASLVEVIPVLRVNGRELAQGSRSVGLGTEYHWALEVLLPGGGLRRIDNRVVAGNVVAIGAGAPGNAYQAPAGLEEGDLDGAAPRFLYARAAAYANAWTQGEEELARLLQVLPVRPTANFVFVQNQLQVDAVLGVRRRLVWKGLEVDADFRAMSPLELVPGRGAALLRLSGYEGSFQEARILTEATQEPAVASVSVLQEAAARGVPVLHLLPGAPEGLGQLSATAEVLRDVEEQLALGREVHIPATPLTLENWTGTGFIARDPATEEGGYFLSGQVSGGQTIRSPHLWTDAQLAELLSQPDAPLSTNDTSQVARIVKLSATDFQSGTVGKPLTRPLTVFVTTQEGIPIRGAQVTFQTADASRPLFRRRDEPQAAPVGQLTVLTDVTGRAAVDALPDTLIERLSFLEPNQPFDQFLGLNVVTASVAGPGGVLALDEPFQFVGRPDAVAHLIPLMTDFENDVGLELGRSLVFTAKDQYGNLLANQTVRWTCDRNTARFIDALAPGPRTVQFLGSDPQRQLPTLEQKTTTFGQSAAGFITGMDTGLYKVTASIGTVSTQFRIEAWPQSRYAFRLASPERALAHGVWGTSTPEPVIAELLRRGGEDGSGNWVRVKGTEPDIGFARVHMYIRDNATGVLLSHETATPSQVGTSPMVTVDRDDNVVFWPHYLLKNGTQLVQFTAEVQPFGIEGSRDCCHESFQARIHSQEAELSLARMRADGTETPVNGCGAIAPADQSLLFSVNNPASYPLYARIVQEPRRAGETLVELSGLGNLPRDPSDGASRVMTAQRPTRMVLPIRQGTRGGRVRLELLAPDPRISPVARTKIGEVEATLDFDTPSFAAPEGTLSAKLVLAVRNFESAATPEDPEDVVSPRATVKPIPIPAGLKFCPGDSGRVRVYSGQALLAAADVIASPATGLGVTPVGPETPVPSQPLPGVLFVDVPPGDPVGQQVRIEFARAGAPTEPLQVRRLTLDTRIEDASALAVGHTFVKDVSTVDGHLVRQTVDLEVPGRRPSLQLTRSYTNRAHEAGPLGRGWSHNQGGYVQATQDAELNVFRYMVVGGEGSGQVFECGPEQTQCRAQRGFHGTFRGETAGTGAETYRQLVFRAQDGTEYRYGRARSTEEGVRHPLMSIRSALGREMVLEYGGESLDFELTRVWEPGNRRFLEFSYARPAGARRLMLTRVDLLENPAAPTRLAADVTGTPLGVCLAYRYNPLGDLESARRYAGGCPSGEDVPALREERYTYAGGEEEDLQTNLVAWTDANGNTTRYEYYGRGDALPGEADFLRFGDKQERVRRVIEPLDAVTEFTYRLVPRSLPLFGQTVQAFETEVRGPRPEVPATVYRMDRYGGVVDVERPLSPGVSARTSAVWNALHVRRDAEQDARGRHVRLKYDALGRLVERRTDLPVLAASGAGGPTEPVRDAADTVLDVAVEKWSHDISFGTPVCQMDAEGRITLHTVDSNGQNPRTGLPTGTGLLLATRRLSTVVPRAQATSDASCQELASALPQSPEDIVTRQEYCAVQGGPCPDGALPGDLSATVDGNGNRSAITAYDVYGYVHTQSVTVETSRQVTTTRTYDARGRLLRESDTFGHETVQTYDGLDRPTSVARLNSKGGSPSLTQQREYYPGGQLQREYHLATGFERHYTLDALNRVRLITESGGGLAGPLVTEYRYDEAGNRVSAIDRRGVETATEYDFGDRPVRVRVAAAPGGTFLAQNGVEGPVGQGGVVATYGYDAAGNRVFETDLHGHRTDYGLDSLYRVVRAQGPEVPGADIDAPARTYETLTRYDLVGNKTRSTDGNGHVTAMMYDFANRLVHTVDPVSRVEERAYDRNGNPKLERWLAGGVEQRRRSALYDGLNRPRRVDETFPTLNGETLTYTAQTAYDDANNTVWTRDARGFVTVVLKDDLDRAYQQTMDVGNAPGALLARQPDDPRLDTALNLTIHFEYDPHGHLAAQVDALGRRTEEDHDALGRKMEQRRPMGVTESFLYDGEGHAIQHTDGRGIVRRTGYDLAGRPALEQLVESLSSNGTVLTTLQRMHLDMPDEDGLVRVVEWDARNASTTSVLDGMHREVSVVDALNHIRESRFDAQNLRVSRDAKGQTTRYNYDASGRPTAQFDFEAGGAAARYSQSTTYDDAARQHTLFDRRGIPTVRLHDGLGRLLRETRGDGNTLRTESTIYNAASQPVAHTDPNNYTHLNLYDAAGRLLEETRGTGTPVEARTRHTYDAMGNRVSTRSPRETGVPYTTRWTYDDLNRQVREEDALGNATLIAYDAMGSRLCVKRPLGQPALGHAQASGLSLSQLQSLACEGTHTTRYTYDEQGNLTGVTDALGGHYSFIYDATRNLVAKQDANGSLTTFEYDVLGQRTAEHVHLDEHPRLTATNRNAVPLFEPGAETLTDVGTLTWRSTYDNNGNLQTFTDAKSQSTVSVHGLLDRLESRTFSNHALPRALPSLEAQAFTYDGNGNLTHTVETKLTETGIVQQTTVRTYNRLDRLEETQLPSGKHLTFEYDPAGQRKRVTDPDGISTRYTYDALGRLSSASIPEGTTSFTYWPDSLPKASLLPNQLTEHRCYDAAGQLLTLILARGAISEDCTPRGALLSRFSYKYTRHSNRLQQTETHTAPDTGVLTPPETTMYGYDAIDRLTGVAYPDDRAILYHLDSVGNRIGEREAPFSALSSLGPEAFHSLPSNQFSRNTSATYNRTDWLLTLSDSLDTSHNRQLTYDANGNLSSLISPARSRTLSWDIRNTLTTVYDNNQETGRYDYDANLQRIWRRTTQESVEYLLDEDFVLQEVDTLQLARRRYHYAQRPLAVTDTTAASSTTRLLHNDSLGSVSDTTSPTGEVVATRKYDAWGSPREGMPPSASDFKLGFTGHQYDVETGLTYARARYYDTALGRFISRDPFELSQTAAPNLHRYVYAANNPTLYTDPSGEVVPLILVGAALIGAELNFFRQAEQNQAISLSDAASQTEWDQVAVSGAAGAAVAGASIASGGAATAFAAQLGAGAVFAGAVGGVAGGAIGGGLNSLSEQAIDVRAGRRMAVDVGEAARSAGTGALLGGTLGSIAGGAIHARSVLVSLGDDLGNAGARGLQEGATEAVQGGTTVTRSLSATVLPASSPVAGIGQRVTEVVEAPIAEASSIARAPSVSTSPARPTLAQVRALRNLGVNREGRRAVFEGKQAAFTQPTKKGDATIGSVQIIGPRLRSGIISVHNTNGGGLSAFTRFRSTSQTVAKSFGLKELELYGGAVINPKIEAMLTKFGFQRCRIPIPEALGADGEMDALSKVFPVD